MWLVIGGFTGRDGGGERCSSHTGDNFQVHPTPGAIFKSVHTQGLKSNIDPEADNISLNAQ